LERETTGVWESGPNLSVSGKFVEWPEVFLSDWVEVYRVRIGFLRVRPSDGRISQGNRMFDAVAV
jgi:hypothetical protein